MKKYFFLITSVVFSGVSPLFSQTGNLEVGSNPSLDFFDILKAGEWVMLPLLIASIVVLSLIAYSFMTLNKRAIISDAAFRRIETLIVNKDLLELSKYVESKQQAVPKVINVFLKFAYKNKGADEKALMAVAEAEAGKFVAHINQRITYILDIGVLAPMLGLFGTVIGILRAFSTIANEVASPMKTLLLAGGVAQALGATAAGLCVGISAMFFYSYFRGRVQSLISYFDEKMTHLLYSILLLQKK